MQYIGLDKQIRKNNFNSLLLLIAFPLLLLGMFYVFFFFTDNQQTEQTNQQFIQVIPFVLIGVGVVSLVGSLP